MKKAKMTFMAILASFAMVGAGAAVAFVTNPAAIVETKAASEIYAFTSKAWADTSSAWTSKKDGNSLQSGRGVQVTTGTTDAGATSKESFSDISTILFTYSTNASSGAGQIGVSVGGGAETKKNVTSTGGTTDRTLQFDYATPVSGAVAFTVTCTTNSIYVKSVKITRSSGVLESIAVSGTVSAKTLDSSWDVSGITVTGSYEGGDNEDITALCNITVADPVPAITADGSTTVQVTATLKDDDTITDTKALTANLTAIPLGCDQLYTANVNDEITIVGKYLASYAQTSNKAPDGVFIGNGDYGAIIYKSDSSLEGVTSDSYIKATGFISEYKGLRELGSTSKKPTFEVISEEEAAPYVSAPKDYTMTGTETNKNLASRQTLVRGTVASVSGTFASDADTTVTITLANENTAKVFLKKNQGSIIDYSGLSTALVEGKEVTIKGILSIFSGDATIEPADFQVILPQLVEEDTSITAEVFCESLMEKTDTICAKAESLRHDELVTAWSDLKNDTFAKMTDEEIDKLKSAAANYANTSENPLENAMGRYNYLTKKYSLDNFLERDVSGAPVASYLRVAEIANGNQATAITVVSIVVASLITVGVVFAIRRKKKAE